MTTAAILVLLLLTLAALTTAAVRLIAADGYGRRRPPRSHRAWAAVDGDGSLPSAPFSTRLA